MKENITKAIISGVIMALVHFLHLTGIYEFIGYIIAYLIVGGEVLKEAIENIFHGEIFDENFLMAIATIGAIALGDYGEAVMVMLLYGIGEGFEDYATDKTRKSIADLMDIRPDYANIEKDGKIEKVNPEEIKKDDLIIIKPGEKIPLDGYVIDGKSMVNTSALTGESVPTSVKAGDEVLSGCINLDGTLTVKVKNEFKESTVVKILDLVENANSKKAKTENFITKFAKYYTPIVVILAVLLAVVPPFVFHNGVFIEWLKRALTFLVISCPCALVISVPLGFFAGIGSASKNGVLIKGSNYMELLSKLDTVVFDKTGTLTKGTFEVTKIIPENISQEELIETAAMAETHSTHPIANSLRKTYGKEIEISRLTDVQEISGNGIKAKIDGKEVLVGNDKLMKSCNIQIKENKEVGTVVYVAKENEFLGSIVISDEIKEDSKEAIKGLNDNKVRKTVMLTGDNKQIAEKVGKDLNIEEVYAELLPEDKVNKLEDLIKSSNGSLAFVGDGINDAPVITRADVGISMGGIGSDASIEAADVVIMDDKPSKLNTAIKISRRTLGIVKQNIIFALAIKIIFLTIGALGYANMWQAVFADVGVTVIAILNSMRAITLK